MFNKFKKTAALACAAVTAVYLLSPLSATAEQANTLSDSAAVAETSDTDNSYLAYYNEYGDAERVTDSITLGIDKLSGLENSAAVSSELDKQAVKLNAENSFAEFSFDVKKAGFYAFTPEYLCYKGSDKDITFSLYLDGELPYTEAGSLEIPRFWKEDGEVLTDADGNDLRPSQIEIYEWNTAKVWNAQGLYAEPYQIYLGEGTHTLKIGFLQEPFAITKLVLENEKTAPNYKDYISEFDKSAYVESDSVILQAEDSLKKSKATIYRTYDNASAATMPNDFKHIKLNTIGQSNWKKAGDTLYWVVPECKEGLYKISFRSRQNIQYGMISFRTLRINGEIPFKEAEYLDFKYKTDWYMKTLGDGEPMYIYIKPGDIISLECIPGPTSSIMRELQVLTNKLNSLYREIMVLTGSSPDVNRDYNLEMQIPDLEKNMLALSKEADVLYKQIEKTMQSSGSQASTIKEMSVMLKELAAKPTDITLRFDSFKSNIESLGSLILLLQEQPLELDYIVFSPKNQDVPSGKVNIFKSFWYSVRRLAASFSNNGDYNPNAKKQELVVWVATGRDQSQIIWRLITEKYMPNAKCSIKLNLVDTGDTLIKAALAGKGPDVALSIPQDKPVNLAMRNALLDLSDYDLTDLKNSTHESAWTPFYYKNGLYAVPQTESFDMLFYRTDIFSELGIEVPETWDEFYDVVKKLQSKNFEVGMSEIDSANQGVSLGIGLFNKFLFQNGETYYNTDYTKTNFDSKVSDQVFKSWTELYTVYGMERSFDFYSRFRSGDMPMGIQGYTMYNQLEQAAPEIRGLWSFAPIPGTRKENGEIDRTQATSISASIVLNSAKEKGIADEAVEFVKWWSGAEIQGAYAKELETTMGIAARYTPANIEAFSSISWTDSEKALLMKQWESSRNVREIPGNYMISRSLTNALRDTISGKNNAFRSLSIYNDVINDEIERKQQEFK